jgi:hypothetical protein
MRILKDIWDDIKHGENLDYYLVFVASLVVLALEVTGGPSAPWTASLTLATLSLLCFAMLRHRHGLDELCELHRSGSRKTLLENYPPSYYEDLSKAREMWLVGMNLRRHFPDFAPEIVKVLSRGGTIKAVVITPGSTASHYAAKQEYHHVSAEEYISTIRLTLTRLVILKKNAPNQVHIRTIDYPLAFGIDAMDVTTQHGSIYVRFYPLSSVDLPILALKPHDSPWYEFYQDQLHKHWNMAVEWVPQPEPEVEPSDERPSHPLV